MARQPQQAQREEMSDEESRKRTAVEFVAAALDEAVEIFDRMENQGQFWDNNGVISRLKQARAMLP